jgi:hypothetical protein
VWTAVNHDSRVFRGTTRRSWARDFLDLAALNARASGAVEEALQRIRGTARSDPHALRSTSIVVLGPPGAGKTHLFSRLRRRVGPRAVFIHIRPLVHAEMTPRFILGEVVRQLAFVTPQGIPQVSALVGSFLGQLGGLGSDFPSTVLSGYAGLEPSERNARLEALLEQVLALWPEVDEPYLLRLSRVPFEPGPTGARCSPGFLGETVTWPSWSASGLLPRSARSMRLLLCAPCPRSRRSAHHWSWSSISSRT